MGLGYETSLWTIHPEYDELINSSRLIKMERGNADLIKPVLKENYFYRRLVNRNTINI